jgi:hypothetical protein
MAVLLPVLAIALGGCPEPDTTPLAPSMANPGKAVSAPMPSYLEVAPDAAPSPDLRSLSPPPRPSSALPAQ